MLNSNWRLLHILHFDLFHEFTFQIDNVEKPSWQAQVTGHKLWTIEAPPECYHVCEQKLEVIIKPGEICKYNFHLWCFMLCSQVLLHYIVFFQKSGGELPDSVTICWTGNHQVMLSTQIAKFMGPTWGPLGPCRPQLGPMLVPWTLLSGKPCSVCEPVLAAGVIHSFLISVSPLPSLTRLGQNRPKAQHFIPFNFADTIFLIILVRPLMTSQLKLLLRCVSFLDRFCCTHNRIPHSSLLCLQYGVVSVVEILKKIDRFVYNSFK